MKKITTAIVPLIIAITCVNCFKIAPKPSTSTSTNTTWSITGKDLLLTGTPSSTSSTENFTYNGSVLWVSNSYVANSTYTILSSNTNTDKSSSIVNLWLPFNPSSGTYTTTKSNGTTTTAADSIYISVGYNAPNGSSINFTAVAGQKISVTGGSSPSFSLSNLKCVGTYNYTVVDTMYLTGTF
jgi:hypothetical protein